MMNAEIVGVAVFAITFIGVTATLVWMFRLKRKSGGN